MTLKYSKKHYKLGLIGILVFISLFFLLLFQKRYLENNFLALLYPITAGAVAFSAGYVFGGLKKGLLGLLIFMIFLIVGAALGILAWNFKEVGVLRILALFGTFIIGTYFAIKLAKIKWFH